MIALDWFRTIQILAANELLVCWTFCVREFGLPAGLTITSMDPTFTVMCGRIIQSSPPFQLAIAEGLDGRGSRFHDYSRMRAAQGADAFRNEATATACRGEGRQGWQSRGIFSWIPIQRPTGALSPAAAHCSRREGRTNEDEPARRAAA